MKYVSLPYTPCSHRRGGVLDMERGAGPAAGVAALAGPDYSNRFEYWAPVFGRRRRRA